MPCPHRTPETLVSPEELPGSKPPPLPGATVVFEREGDDRPEIVIGTDIEGIVDQAESALLLPSKHQVFQRARLPVVVAHTGRRSSPGFSHPKGAPFVAPIGNVRMREILSSSVRWLRYDRRAAENVPAMPPDWVAQSLLARETSVLPILRGVVQTPVLRGDGSLMTSPGYDEASGLFLEPGGLSVPSIADRPTLTDVERAVERIFDVLCDFPFAAQSDRVAVLCAILTVLHRHSTAGPVPLFALRAPTPASGKGLLMKVISLVTTGRMPGTMAPSLESDELRKVLLTLAVEDPPLVLFDNVVGQFGSPLLAAAVTADEWSGRWLGANRTVTAPLRPCWFITGNNITFKADFPRRVVPCDLEPIEEHPEDRRGFRHLDLTGHVLAHRGELVADALTVLRGFALAGKPASGLGPMGSFDAWDREVRSACVWATGVDPCAGRMRIREDDDDELGALRSLLIEVHRKRDTGSWRVADLVADAAGDPAVAEALAALGLRERDLSFDTTRVGNGLRRYRKRPAGGLRLEVAETRSGGRAQYRVARLVAAAAAAGGVGGLGGVLSSLRAKVSEGNGEADGVQDRDGAASASIRPEQPHQVHQPHLGGPPGDPIPTEHCHRCGCWASAAHECPGVET